MANYPVESMKTGGLYWFADLTVADPYYVLPILTSLTLFLQFKIGAEYGTKMDQMKPAMKAFMTLFPCLLLAFTHSFPAGLTLYWCATNIISVLQARVLRVPRLREAFSIPMMVKHEVAKAKTGGKSKGFMESIRQTMDNAQVKGRAL
jgi:YidC/Oxa1 family membrane protein insertase